MWIGDRIRPLLLVGMIALLGGCVGSGRPDLRRLYEAGANQAVVPSAIGMAPV